MKLLEGVHEGHLPNNGHQIGSVRLPLAKPGGDALQAPFSIKIVNNELSIALAFGPLRYADRGVILRMEIRTPASF